MAIAPLPTPPSRGDSANFAARGDALLSALPAFVAEANALQEDVSAKQEAASNAADSAAEQASIATTKASEAADSATSANDSKNAAAQSAADALASKSAAELSATAAANSAASVDAQGFATDYAGTTEPPVMWPYMKWADTGDDRRKLRNAANTAWIDQGPLSTQALVAPVVGTMRNGKMHVSAASATATFTADEIVVSSGLGGTPYRLANYNQTINLATTGAGGMDTGTAPVSGWVALYAIYNPSTGTKGILAVNATSAAAPEVYGGASMPAGYTASALISVWPTNAGRLFQIGLQHGRKVEYQTNIYTGEGVVAFTALNVSAAVPANAKTLKLNWTNVAGSGAVSVAISPTAGGAGTPGYNSISNFNSGGNVVGHLYGIPIITPQQIYHAEGGPGAHVINCYGYTF